MAGDLVYVLNSLKKAFKENQTFSVRKGNSLHGTAWIDVDYSGLRNSGDDVASLPIAQYVLRLPSFIRIVAEDFEKLDVERDVVLSRLIPPLTNGRPRDSWLREINVLSEEQKRAVSAALVYLRVKYKCQFSEQALDLYWNSYMR